MTGRIPFKLGGGKWRRVTLALCAGVAAVMVVVGTAGATHTPADVDGDGWANSVDNCPSVYNDRLATRQLDADGDGIGDACDSSWNPDPNGENWSFKFYFVDGAQEPQVASTCATVTVTEVVYYPAPYDFYATNGTGPTHVCESDGQSGFGFSEYKGSFIQLVSRTYEIDCDSGGTLSGSIPVNVSYYVPVGPACTFSGMHEYGGAPAPQTYGQPGGTLGPNPSATQAEPVDTATGSYFTSATDLRLNGFGIPFTLTRSYNSADSTVGPLGRGWTENFNASLGFAGNGDATARAGDGQQLLFVHQSDGSFRAAAGGTSTLVASGGNYLLVTQDQTHYTFDAQGRLTRLADRNNAGLALSYDGAGNLATVTDSGGRQVTFTFTGPLLTAVQLPDGRLAQYGYTNGLLTSVTDARGNLTQYTYDGAGRLQSIIDQNSQTLVTNTYDASSGRVTDQIDARGGHSYFSWDSASQTSTYTDPRGNSWRDIYANNVIVKQLDPLGDGTIYQHDDNLNVTAVTDPRGNTTTMTYDAAGNLKTRGAPSPFTFGESWTYDPFNNVKTYTNGRGNTTSYGYDTSGNLTSISGPDPDGTGGPLTAPVTTITRDPAGTGLITAVQDPRLKTTQYGHDVQGNLTSIQTPLGNTTTMHYDTAGRIDFLVEPRGNVLGADPAQYKWLYSYNAANQLHTQSDPLGHTTTFDYFPNGALQTKSDANGHATNYTYWSTGEIKTTTTPDPDGAGPLAAPVTSYAYDAVGNPLSRTDANQNITNYTYDAANRIASLQTPLGKSWTYGHDAAGNINSIVDANGNATPTLGDGTTTYGYDNLNRLSSIGYSDTPTTPNVSYTYDEDSDRKTTVDGAGSVSYTYDNLDRLATTTRGTSSFAYSYDSSGNVLQRTYPDSTAVTYTYDNDGRTQSVASTGVGTTSSGYDAAGDLTSTTLPSGNGYAETRSYDRAGRITEIKNAKGASTLSDFVQTLDPVGNPLSVIRSGATSATNNYSYDNLDRLTTVCFQAACPNSGDPKISWTYDGVGNRLTETRAASSTTYLYDVDNKLTQSTRTPGVNPYSVQVRTDGAQPYWRYAETAGTWFDSTVGSFTGTWTGSPTLGATGALNGDSDKAVTLNGTSQYGAVSSASQLAGTTSFSLEIWVKRSKAAASQAVIGKPLTITTKSENYALWFDTANKIRFEVGASNKSTTLTSAAALDTNWHHIVGTFSSGAMKLYVDGNLSASITATFTAAVANTNTLDIGRSGTTNYYGGTLDEAAFYPTALTAAQVSDHFSKGASAPPATTGTTYGYDNDGHETTAGANSFTWNLDGKLTGSTVLGTGASYTYDGDGNRLTVTSGGATTNQLWDINNSLPQLALERDASNNLLRRYLVGTDLNSMTTPTGTFFYHHDPLDSVANVTNATGATQWTYGYEPYGAAAQTVKGVSGAPVNPVQYTGQYADATDGLYHLRARPYDPATGRFLARDPQDPTGVATYVYAEDRPLFYTDPSGQSVRGAIHTIVGTIQQVPNTLKAIGDHPGVFIGSAASYVAAGTILVAAGYYIGYPCLTSSTVFLGLLGTIDHPGACASATIYAAGPSLPLLWAGWEGSKSLARDEPTGGATK